MSASALIWLRRDLRVADNPALHAAVQDGLTPLPVYVHDEPAGHWPLGQAAGWWLHHSLNALDRALCQLGSRLLVARGECGEQLLRLCEATGAKHIFCNRVYEPRARERDTPIRAALRDRGIQLREFNGSLLCKPNQLLKADATPYRVFTPFWNALQHHAPQREALPAPDSLPAPPACTDNELSPDDLGLLPRIPWYSGFEAHWQPGEDGAHRALRKFCSTALADYPDHRNLPALAGTSRLSPHLHFGELSPRQAWQALRHARDERTAAGTVAATESWQRQLAWREFAYHLLHHFPDSTDAPLDTRFEQFPWRADYAADLERWQRGETGFPIVDAGMRELWHTGWMHNRVRMIVASLLTKNLLIPWQEGARWFWDTLVDADLANNTLGWQWTAGCGVDAAPYFRVFNPIRQGERFDADGSYVRRWVPQLQGLPAKWIHQPWAAPANVLADAQLSLGERYPHPMVDLQHSRARALAVWERIKDLRE